uniref:RRM domain-containing protein n=1 Tax=Zea mays TaxID=4577 RepID=A0A804MB40_MAIZE|eukprot:XP_008667991.1 nucleic acid binding protein isoform X1 [Zea mays]
MATSMLSTVKVSNVSLKAAQRDIKEFFSFSGDIVHVEMQRLVPYMWCLFFTLCYDMINYLVLCSFDELSQVAYITFKDKQGAETAMLLTGATIVDMAVIVTPANDYELPSSVLAALEPKDTKPSALQKAEDIVGTMLAKGFILGRDALDKAKALDEKHQLTSTATARVSSFDKRIGLSEKISVGTSVVNDKVKEMDQKYQVSEKTKSALAAAEHSVSTAGSAIMKNRYVLTGAAWVTGAFSKVTSAANEAGAKAKEKIAVEQEHKNAEGGPAQANISETHEAHRGLDGGFSRLHDSETPEDIPISTASVPAVTDEEPSKASPPAGVPEKPEAAHELVL